MDVSNAMFDVIKGDLEQLEERLIEAVSSPEDELVTEVGTHLVTSGGKRIRPALCLLAAHGGPAFSLAHTLPLATALAILSLGLFLQPAAAPPEDSPLQAPAAATTMPQVPARQQEAAEPATSWQEPQGQAAGAKASGGQAREVPQERVAPQAAPAAAAEPEPQREIQAPRPPSPEKQKLMQSAGKALRAS